MSAIKLKKISNIDQALQLLKEGFKIYTEARGKQLFQDEKGNWYRIDKNEISNHDKAEWYIHEIQPIPAIDDEYRKYIKEVKDFIIADKTNNTYNLPNLKKYIQIQNIAMTIAGFTPNGNNNNSIRRDDLITIGQEKDPTDGKTVYIKVHDPWSMKLRAPTEDELKFNQNDAVLNNTSKVLKDFYDTIIKIPVEKYDFVIKCFPVHQLSYADARKESKKQLLDAIISGKITEKDYDEFKKYADLYIKLENTIIRNFGSTPDFSIRRNRMLMDVFSQPDEEITELTMP